MTNASVTRHVTRYELDEQAMQFAAQGSILKRPIVGATPVEQLQETISAANVPEAYIAEDETHIVLQMSAE